MSDVITNDSAIESLRERVRQLDAENAIDTNRIAARTMCRDEYSEMIETLSRKLRPRKQRVVFTPVCTATDDRVIDETGAVGGG